MNLIDKIKYAYAHGEEMPLKGHVKITLEDIRDGKQKIVEGDNFITNAVGSILAKNWGGMCDMASLFPLWRSLYSGVIMFQNAFNNPTADSYNPPSETINPSIAHAGDQAPAIGWTENKRGTPVPNEYTETPTSIKQCWLWDNSAGNGTINTVCLCPKELGNFGLTPSNEGQWTSRYSNGRVVPYTYGSTYSRNLCMQNPFSIASDGKSGKSIYWSGTAFEEITVRHDYLAFGIMRDSNSWQEVSSRTATVRSASNNSNIFEDENYYYAYTITGADDIQIDRISKSDFSVTQMDLNDIPNVALYTGAFVGQPLTRMSALFAYDGRYLYVPNSSGNGFVGINPNDISDKLVLDGTINLHLTDNNDTTGDLSKHSPVVISQGLVFGDRYIINGASIYPKSLSYSPSTDSDERRFYGLHRVGASVYAMPWRYDYSYNLRQGAILVPMMLSSIFTLEDEISKGATQTMRCEYSLTEQT